MLAQLSIQNFALIDKIKLDLKSGLSVITGETGAGKSILLGALGLILGKRADHTILKDKTRKCIVEGTFQIESYDLQSLFLQLDLDYLDETLIRREINGSGKSRSFINDTPVTLDVMKLVGSQLIDIHSQQQSLQINDTHFQLEVLDAYAGNLEVVKEYKSVYYEFNLLSKKLLKAKSEIVELKQEEDFLNFQFKELEDLKLTVGENRKLEVDQNRFANSEEILNCFSQLNFILDQDETNILSQINRLNQLANSVSSLDPSFSEVSTRIKSVLLELQDIQSEVESKTDDYEYQPEQHQFVEERLAEIHRLQNKHYLPTADDLIDFKDKLEEKLLSISNSDENLEVLEKEIAQKNKILTDLAHRLTKNRLSITEALQLKVENTLNNLGIPHAKFEIQHSIKPEFGLLGKDVFQFLFSANKGIAPSLVSKTASGGESSRLMLAIKEILAENQKLPTILFDEIDTGVSGEIAEKMGDILAEMGEKRQVISITHLPQLAAKGKQHYYVYKTDTEERSITEIRQLKAEERVEEVAKMLSGAKMTDAAMNNAKELLHQ